MSEGQNLEQEIAELSAQIEEKRAALERERGSAVESHEVLHTIVGEMVLGPRYQVSAPKPKTYNLATSTSYLDDLDPAVTEKVNSLIDLIPTLGLSKTIARAKEESPQILDAFHDALTDKLREELKRQNLI